MIIYTQDLVQSLLEKEGSRVNTNLPTCITRLTEITFQCVCGKEGMRRAEQLYNLGGICWDCIKKRRVDKIRHTNLERYGVEFPMQSKELLDKRRQNYIDTIGVAAPLQLDYIKDIYREKVYSKKTKNRKNGGNGNEGCSVVECLKTG